MTEVAYLHGCDFSVVSILHLSNLPLQGLIGAPQGLYLNGLGLQLPPELTDLLPAGPHGLIAPGGLLAEAGKLALVPLLGRLQVFGSDGLVLVTDLLQSRGEVRFGELELHGHLLCLHHAAQLLHFFIVHFPQEGDFVHQRLHAALQVQANCRGIIHILPEGPQGLLSFLPRPRFLIVPHTELLK